VLRHAFRVDFWDVEETANKVVGLLTHPALWEEMSEAGLEEVRSPKLGLDEAAGKTAAVYTRTWSDVCTRTLSETVSQAPAWSPALSP
jgi:glycosyltransferase involved in cell wall biosynthesis